MAHDAQGHLEYALRSRGRAKQVLLVNVAVLAAALLAITAHELSHALATHAVGGRVERVEISLQNGSRTVAYYPYVERLSYWDPYVVGGAGLFLPLLVIVGVMSVRRCRGMSLAADATAGVWLGAYASGLLGWSLTGQVRQSSDLGLLANLASGWPVGFRLACGVAGVALGLWALALIRRLIGGSPPRSWPRLGALASLGLCAYYTRGAILGLVCVVVAAVVCWMAESNGGLGGEGWSHRERRGVLGLAALSLASLAVTTRVGDHGTPAEVRTRCEQERLAAYRLAGEGKWSLVVDRLEGLTGADCGPGLAYDLGKAYRMVGRMDDSIAALTPACQEIPLAASCHAQLARAYEGAGRSLDAAGAWRAAATCEARNPDKSAASRHVRIMLTRAEALESTPSQVTPE